MSHKVDLTAREIDALVSALDFWTDAGQWFRTRKGHVFKTPELEGIQEKLKKVM